MHVLGYLRDRLGYIATFVGAGLLAAAVIRLDLHLSGAVLRSGGLAYSWLLGLLCLALWLACDYRREVRFLRHLAAIDQNKSVDELGVLPEAGTLQQRLFARAWAHLYGRLRGELSAEQARGRQQIELISQWAHHMKTPVAVIDLELQKARHREWPEEVRAVLASIQEETERLRHSLQMLLNMVRLEEFAADFRVEPVDLVALVRQVVNEHKRTFITHRVYPRIELPDPEALPPELLVVESDAKWLRFVLEQLVSNAVKYAAETDREGRVCFRFHRMEAETILEVADNGIGIPPEDLGRVFDPFFTGINGRAHPQATGMGLYLARQTCQRLGHRLQIESVRGEGTRASIIFPDSRTLFTGLHPSLTKR
ncbi:MAG TPA: sensor histidine kinase [Symbiobacteriaceae bacterium]